VKIVISSHNPVKVGAVSDAFQALFSSADMDFVSVRVDSGVREQPLSDSETRSGARNRAANARQLINDADFWVGLEGGLEQQDGCLLASAWMVVLDRNGRSGEARTASLPLPPAVARLVAEGLELGEANDRIFSTANSKLQGGAFGLLTNGRMTRRSVYAQAVQLALLPLTHSLWPGSPAGSGS
jgi:inosine/xanthosine triphosphatase